MRGRWARQRDDHRAAGLAATNTQRRSAAKVLLVDESGRVLLFRGGDPGRSEAGTWWFPAGGGVEPGESLEAAARREVLEETGLALGDVGGVVHQRTIEFEFDGVTYLQDEHYFVVTVERFEVSSASWTDLERRVVVEHRWWSRDELDDTHDTVFPEGLGELLGAVTSTRS